MSIGYTSVLATAQSDGTTLVNIAAQGSLIPSQAKYALPGSFLTNLGQELVIEASGKISTVAVTPGTLQFIVRMVSSAAAVNVALTQALALNTTSKTDVTWFLRWQFTVRALGAAANFMHTGFWSSEAVVGSPTPAVGGSGTLLIPASAPVVSSNFDSNIAQVIDFQGKWSVADPANSITLNQYRLISLN